MLEVTWTSKINDVVEELDHMFIYLISQTILQSSDDNSGSSLSIEELQNVRRFMNQIEILTKMLPLLLFILENRQIHQNCYPVAVLLKNSQGSGHKKNDWQW